MSLTPLADRPCPEGNLAIQTLAMSAHTNPQGDIFAGCAVAQMDLAAGIAAAGVAKGRVATVTINDMLFLTPVHIGAIVSCYTQVTKIGCRSVSITASMD